MITHRIRTILGSQVRRNTLAGAGSAIASALISAVSYPLYLHFLGYEQYGLWLAIAVVLSFVQFGNLGFGPAVATEIAADYARGDFNGIRTTITTALFTLTALGFAAVAGVLLFGGYIIAGMRLSPALANQAHGLLPFVAVLSVYVLQIETLNSLLVGVGRLDLSVGTHLVCRALSVAIAYSLLAAGLGIISLPMANLAGYVVLHISSLVLMRYITGHGCLGLRAFEFSRLRRLAGFGSGVVASSLINLLLGPLNKFVLTRDAGPSHVPVYELAFTLSMQVRGVLESGFRSLMPEVTRLDAVSGKESPGRIAALNRRALKVIVVAGLPMFGIAYALAEAGLRLWLRSRFQPELVPATRVLLAGCFVSLLGVPGYFTLLGLGRVRQILASNVAQAGVNAGIVGTLGLLSIRATTGMTATAAAAGVAVSGIYCLIAAQARLSSGRAEPSLACATADSSEEAA